MSIFGDVPGLQARLAAIGQSINVCLNVMIKISEPCAGMLSVQPALADFGVQYEPTNVYELLQGAENLYVATHCDAALFF